MHRIEAEAMKHRAARRYLLAARSDVSIEKL